MVNVSIAMVKNSIMQCITGEIKGSMYLDSYSDLTELELPCLNEDRCLCAMIRNYHV